MFLWCRQQGHGGLIAGSRQVAALQRERTRSGESQRQVDALTEELEGERQNRQRLEVVSAEKITALLAARQVTVD
jgi:hypothetical protein